MATVSTARADDPRVEAKKHVDAATAHHTLHHWKQALAELTLAYSLDPQPQLLYAMAQLHVKLGNCPTAITFYERFLSNKPKPALVALATEAIELCKTNPPPPEPEAEAEPKPKPEPEPKPEPAVTPVPKPVVDVDPWYDDPLGLGFAGAGLALGAAAIAIYAVALDDISEADKAPYSHAQSLVHRASTDRLAAALLGGTAIGATCVGVIHVFVRNREHPVSSAVSVIAAPSGGFVTWAGRF